MKNIEKLVGEIFDLPEAERNLLVKHLNAAAAKEKPQPSRRGYFTMNQIAASSSEHVPLLKNILASARRLGFQIDPDKAVDLHAMDEALRGADVTGRLALKATMAKIGMIQ
jgi:hypothetical protein